MIESKSQIHLCSILDCSKNYRLSSDDPAFYHLLLSPLLLSESLLSITPLPSPYSGVDFVLLGTIHYSVIRYPPLQQFQSGCGWDEPHFLIYMLSSRTWWSESINLQFRRKNRNRFGPLHDRRHRNRGKRGVTTTVFIKGRNAHETMNSTFLRKIGRHIVTIDTKDTTMASRSFALLWKTVTTPTHVLSKIPIHFEEHASPITRIFTSRTSMKF